MRAGNGHGGLPDLGAPAAAHQETVPLAQIATVDTMRDGEGQTYAVLSLVVPGAAITAAIPESIALRYADQIRACASGISLT